MIQRLEVTTPLTLISSVTHPDEANKKLNPLDANKSKIAHKIHPNLLASLACNLPAQLAKLYNGPISKGEPPDELTSLIICRIYTKVKKKDVANYGLICLDPVICKILEWIIKANSLQWLKVNSMLNDAQHGFVSRHWYRTELIKVKGLITGKTSQSEPVNVVYLDSS